MEDTKHNNKVHTLKAVKLRYLSGIRFSGFIIGLRGGSWRMPSSRGHGAAASRQESSHTHYCVFRIHPCQFNMLRQDLTPVHDRNFRAAVEDENNWGPLQTRKGTRQILRPSLYSRPFGIQAPDIGAQNLNTTGIIFPISNSA